MKRILILFVCSCLLLSGCGSAKKWSPQLATEEMEPYARRAINVIDQYLGFEISKEDAGDLFNEITDRMPKPYDSVGLTVYYAIFDLYYHSDELADIDFRKYRDILAFQLGEPTSGLSYDVEYLDITDGERVIAEQLGVLDTPCFNFGMSKLDTGYGIILSFDELNGVYPADLYEYIETVKHNAESKNIILHAIIVSYYCYEQQAFALSIWFNPVDPDRQVDVIGVEGDGFDVDDYAELAAFDSTEKVPDALKVASDYLGEYFS